MAERVSEIEVGPFDTELLESDRDRDEVGWADLEEVREDATTLVRVAQVEAALAEFFGEVVVHLD